MQISYSKNTPESEVYNAILTEALEQTPEEFPYLTHVQNWNDFDISSIESWQKNPNVLVCGVGGSDLGTRALYRSVKKEDRGIIFFTGDTTDAVAVQTMLHRIPKDESLVVVLVSKSGKSLEPISAFARAVAFCEEHAIDHKKIFITDKGNGPLVEYGPALADLVLTIPQEIGGRFSALTAVGLAPLTIAGYREEVQSFIEGAASATSEEQIREISTLAAILNENQASGFTNHTMMTYDYQLEYFGEWWKQLIGESLGKNESITQLPITAKGPTDQHSQLQRWVEGSKNVLLIMVSGKNQQAHPLPAQSKILEILSPELAGKDSYQLLSAQLEGTKTSLINAGVPVLHLKIKKTPNELGAYMMQWFLATWLLGKMWKVNPYGQPGVEEGKQITHKLISEL